MAERNTPVRILVNDFAGHPFQIQLSREFASAGHQVLHTFFGANNTPKGRVLQNSEDGPHLVIEPVCINTPFRKYSIFSRRKADVCYGEAVRARILQFCPDVVISANTPLDAQRILLAAAHDSGARFVFWLQDLLSAGMEFVLRKKGVPLSGAVGRIYAHLEQRLLLSSDAVICIASGFAALLRRWGVESSRTFVIENWAPLDEVNLLPQDNAWSRELGVAGKFCFMYSGTLGMKHKPELLLELARHFDKRDDVAVIVVAQGAGADWLRTNPEVRGSCCLLLPLQPYERLSEVLATASVLITLLDKDCGTFAVPSKTLSYMCAARPILVAAPEFNLAAEIVRRASAGEVVPADDSQSFLAAASRLLEDHGARQHYAANARAYAERRFDIAQISRQFVDVLQFALRRSTTAGPIKVHEIEKSVGSAD